MGEQREAKIYIDGQNLRGSAINFFGLKDVEFNVPRVLESLVRLERDISLKDINYYTGIEPRSGVAQYRGKAIGFLDSLNGQGIKTFANDLEIGPLGRRKEVGIDLKIAADMVSDMLNRRADTFILLSNDRDYEPVFALMADLAKRQKLKVDLAVITCGPQRGCTNARKIILTADLVQRHIQSLAPVHKQAEENLAKDQERALDASMHVGRPEIMPPRATPPVRGTAYLIDLNSIGTTAKSSGRPYLDADMSQIVRSVSTEIGKPPKGGVAFASVHTKDHDLVNKLLVNGMIDRLRERRFTVYDLPYEYTKPIVAYQDAGAGSSTPVRTAVAREKRIDTTMLTTVVNAVLGGKYDDFVLVSDNPNLWPIANIAAQMGRMTNTSVSVSNVHLGDRPIPGMPSHRISQTTYEATVEPENRLENAKVDARKILLEERDALVQYLMEKGGPDIPIKCVTNPLDAEGVFVSQSTHWHAMYEGEGQYALFEHLPSPPKSGQVYRMNNGKMMEAIVRDPRQMDHDISRAFQETKGR